MANAVPFMRANNGHYPMFPDASVGEKTCAEWTHGMSLWELFRKEPEHLKDFSNYLAGRREAMVECWFDIWPARETFVKMLEETPDQGRALVVDVGGNVGYDLQAFQSRFPEFNGKGGLVLQDLAENIGKAKGLLEGTGIEVMEHDFFTAQPVKGALLFPNYTFPRFPILNKAGARIYYLGGILHDWPDTQAASILRNLKDAMAPDSRIIIDEMCLPDEKAPLHLVQYDLLMMIQVAGIERTIGHYRELLGGVGLELVGVWRSRVDSCLEVKLRG
jgi:hypothetical protein